MSSIKAQLSAQKSVVPVVVIDRAQDAHPLAQAIKAGGGISIEITLRTEAALDAIKAVADSEVDLIVGAGTVLTLEEADKAIAAGAQFLVSPGFDAEIVQFAERKGVLMIPGVMTPSEAISAIRLKLDLLKFFPAELAGGVKMLKTFASVFPNVRFMPTGGIGMHNIDDYAALDNLVAIGGSWVCDKALIKEGNFEEITRLMREASARL